VDKEQTLVEGIKRGIMFGRDVPAPKVDQAKCTSCGDCARVCPGNVLEVRSAQAEVTNAWRCIACGHCVAVCPEGAVTHPEASTAVDLEYGPRSELSGDDLQQLIRERRSVRVFRNIEVSREQLLAVVEAGRYTPTGGNRQDINYVILPHAEKVDELRAHVEGFLERTSRLLKNPLIAPFLRMKYGREALDVMRYYVWGYSQYRDIPVDERRRAVYFPTPFAPSAIVVHARSFDAVAGTNCSAALYACALKAHSLGLGSCFVGFVPFAANMDKRARAWLRIPQGNQVYGALVVGHPAVTYRRLIERRQQSITWI
jgi:nitroreductase/Pyruvate/2-oxoacid:ferredoxin oxidoreductase delta subunit